MSVEMIRTGVSPVECDRSESASWHSQPVDRVLACLRSGEGGLTDAEAARRLERYGPNLLKPARPPSALRILWDQARSLVILLLFVAAAGALLVGDHLEAAAIGAVLVLNTGIGFWMEWRARVAMEALRRMQVHEAVVVRDGRERRIDARALVPGDLVVLEAGAAIAADARIVWSAELRAIEAPLTGESEPVAKSAEPVGLPADEGVPLAERASMVYKGTLVAAGSGRAVVVGTGRATEIGRIQELVEETEPERTPLERRLDSLGRRLVAIALGAAAVVSVLGVWRGGTLWPMIETGIALAIAAVPEGLPVVATITLAVGMRRMARRHALVRRLPAVETLGSTTVVCADKTGTLTAGEMTVRAVYVAGGDVEATGSGYARAGEFRIGGRAVDARSVAGLEPALRIGALANRARLLNGSGSRGIHGDPTEAALLVAASKAGLERDRLRREWPEIAEVPFSSERRWMATFHRSPGGGTVAYVKGAPDRVLEMSARALGVDAPHALDDAARRRWRSANRRLAERGLRVLAVGELDLAPDATPGPDVVRGLTFVGLIGMIDPPAPGVRETIARLHRAGVRTVMITGDQAITAAAVGRELGVIRSAEDETLDGRVIAKLSDDDLTGRVGRAAVFSRVSPEDKLRIVRAYQRRGEIVGMLGDGVNDAPALRRADIGVAMGGRGTDVAKETAAVVLQDDRFETIGVAVEQGRVIFDNIRKFIFYLFSCNLSEVLVLLVAGLAGWPLPLLPLQILWLNLITDVFPALALAMEAAEPDVMSRPPRDPRSAILSRRFLALIGGFGMTLTAATLGVFLWALHVWRVELGHAVTLAFMTLGFTQLLHVFNARGREAVFRTRRWLENGWVWGAIAVTTALQLAAVYLRPLADILRTHPLGLEDWGLVGVGALLPLVAGQAWKLTRGPRALEGF